MHINRRYRFQIKSPMISFVDGIAMPLHTPRGSFRSPLEPLERFYLKATSRTRQAFAHICFQAFALAKAFVHV